jgi:hypothetical protein
LIAQAELWADALSSFGPACIAEAVQMDPPTSLLLLPMVVIKNPSGGKN